MSESCGDCSLCCKLLAIEEIAKPACEWCPSAVPRRVGGACTVYEARPETCRAFRCVWLTSQADGDGALPPEMRPDRSHVVMTGFKEQLGLVLHIDPARPAAHTRGGFPALIQHTLATGLDLLLVCGERRKLIAGERPS
jgi:hypothetical protein